MLLYRFFRFIILVLIFYGVGLALLGLWGSAGQATSGVTGFLRDIAEAESGLPGARVVRAGANEGTSNEVGLPPTRTPFQPAPAGQVPNTGGSVAMVETSAPAVPSPTATPVPSPTARPVLPPERIVIDQIGLDAPVVIIPKLELILGEDVFQHWQAPNYYAAGWHEGSALLGEKGNSVLSGHNNIGGMVFGRLLELQKGDSITLVSGSEAYHYEVSQVMKFEERDQPIQQRIENARWILPSDDERLTLVTCWPPESNTYRLIVVAVPVD